MRLWSYIKSRMLSYPDQVISEEGIDISFENVVIWAEVFAKKLHGIKCCAILCRSEMSAAMGLLACIAAGVTAIPISIRYGTLHCEKIIDMISPDAILTDESGEIDILRTPDSRYVVPGKHPALIMCTSGTTGKPKGVMLSEANIISNVTDISSYFKIDETDTILISRTIYHCAVLTGEFLTALVKGTNITFYSEKFNPSKMLELIRDHGITAFGGTPTLLGMMSRFKKDIQTDSLKHICISGECMGKDAGLRIADAFPDCDIYHVYGLTEACPRISYLPPKLFRDNPDSVGIPLRSVSIKLLKQNGKECQAGEEGILWVKGDNVMLGYYCEADKTAEVLQNGWLCTGDIAVINDNGLLKIKGRTDDLIIKAGMNIYPAEVEAEIKQDIRVKEALVYGLENRFGTQICMKIAGDFSSADEVKEMCAERLPVFQIPAYIELVPELQKNGSGKIIRKV